MDLDPESCVMGEWDHDAVRRLFNSLEFRTLLERLEDVERAAKPKVEAAALDVRAGSAAELSDLLSKKGPKAVYPSFDDGVGGLAISMGGGQALYVPFERMPDVAAEWLGDPDAPKWVHDAKDLQAALLVGGCALEGVVFDTLLAAYLIGRIP